MPWAMRDCTLIMEPAIALYNEWWFAVSHFCCNEIAMERMVSEQFVFLAPYSRSGCLFFFLFQILFYNKRKNICIPRFIQVRIMTTFLHKYFHMK